MVQFKRSFKVEKELTRLIREKEIQLAKLKEHIDKSYDFSKFNLSMFPTSYTISEPFDHVITEEFTPFAVVRPGAVLGDYNGTLLFTLGVL